MRLTSPLCRWHDAIRTLAKLHRISPASVDLASFGKPTGFYGRQLKTFGGISLAQAAAEDRATGAAVGKIPHFDGMVAFFERCSTMPADRGTLVHGDYKIDNLVYHRSEPRVIGILDWEMSTVGHPLSDLANLLTPYLMAPRAAAEDPPLPPAPRPHPAFCPGATAGLPDRDALLALYGGVAGWDPAPAMPWGDAFGVFRNSVIMQGIAARYALRQATSEKAAEHGRLMFPFGEYAWGLVRRLMARQEAAAKL